MEIDRELGALQRRMAELAAGPQESGPAFAGAVERFETVPPSGRPVARAAIDRLVDANAARSGVDRALISAIIA
ncbi:MAG: hypothetical protein JO324_09220, partial [Candidatus Eremiobacteraeota bacterium]|nr:hypothetical protein [Candidatus Eremiobacteraeota bacterium]